MIEFAWPWAFVLAPLPLLLRWLLPPAPVAGALELPIGPELRTLVGDAPRFPWRRALLPLLAWTLLVLAAALPRWTGAPVALPVHARDLLLAVDASGSMAEKRVDPSRPELSRLESVQALAGRFIARREGDRVGLILFGTQAYLYAPLSLDRKTVAALLAESEVGLAGDGTAIGDAIAVGVRHLRETASGARVLVLLTDGENTAGAVPPIEAAELAAAAGVRIHTIAFGEDSVPDTVLRMLGVQPAGVDAQLLKRIAKRTGGRHFHARDTVELERIYRLLDQVEPAEVEARRFRPTRALFHWPLAGALALAVLVLARRGALR